MSLLSSRDSDPGIEGCKGDRLDISLSPRWEKIPEQVWPANSTSRRAGPGPPFSSLTPLGRSCQAPGGDLLWYRGWLGSHQTCQPRAGRLVMKARPRLKWALRAAGCAISVRRGATLLGEDTCYPGSCVVAVAQLEMGQPRCHSWHAQV